MFKRVCNVVFRISNMKVRIGRDYAMEIDLNVNYEMFSGILLEDQTEEHGKMKESA